MSIEITNNGNTVIRRGADADEHNFKSMMGDIDRLAKDNERLRAALTTISHCDLAQDAKFAQETAAKIAKEALKD